MQLGRYEMPNGIRNKIRNSKPCFIYNWILNIFCFVFEINQQLGFVFAFFYSLLLFLFFFGKFCCFSVLSVGSPQVLAFNSVKLNLLGTQDIFSFPQHFLSFFLWFWFRNSFRKTCFYLYNFRFWLIEFHWAEGWSMIVICVVKATAEFHCAEFRLAARGFCHLKCISFTQSLCAIRPTSAHLSCYFIHPIQWCEIMIKCYAIYDGKLFDR